MSRLSFRPRPLDIHKKLPIVKSVKDLDNDEAATVSRTVLQDHGVGNSDNEAVQSTSTKRRGGDIPTPQYSVVETYERDYSRTFMQPSSYVRSRGARNEPIEFVEYDLDDEDEDWLEQFNSERRILLPERFEWMLYKLELLDHKCRERAGEMPTILGVAVPVLLQQEVAVEALRSQNSRSAVLSAVCDYWKAKREQWQKPILRRLQPPPPVNDTNPFNVFRPREKVHRPHTRRMQRRENDVQSFEKLRQVRRNLERARALLGVIQKREVKKRELVECEANLQRVQITFKHDSQVDDEDLMVSSCAMVTTYPRKSSFFKRDAGDALPQQSNFARGTSNFVNGHVDIQPMCELTPPFTDGAVMLEPVDQSKRKGRRRRLPQQRGRPLKRGTALDSLEPVLLFTKPLDAEKLAATGLVPPLDSSQENGSAREPYCFHGRVGRGGRIIFDRCNPLTRTPLGYSNSASTFSRLASVTRFLPPPPRLNLETSKPLETKSSAVDGTLESTLNGDLRTS